MTEHLDLSLSRDQIELIRFCLTVTAENPNWQSVGTGKFGASLLEQIKEVDQELQRVLGPSPVGP